VIWLLTHTESFEIHPWSPPPGHMFAGRAALPRRSRACKTGWAKFPATPERGWTREDPLQLRNASGRVHWPTINLLLQTPFAFPINNLTYWEYLKIRFVLCRPHISEISDSKLSLLLESTQQYARQHDGRKLQETQSLSMLHF
jgi:hypothetical protein